MIAHKAYSLLQEKYAIMCIMGFKPKLTKNISRLVNALNNQCYNESKFLLLILTNQKR